MTDKPVYDYKDLVALDNKELYDEWLKLRNALYYAIELAERHLGWVHCRDVFCPSRCNCVEADVAKVGRRVIEDLKQIWMGRSPNPPKRSIP